MKHGPRPGRAFVGGLAACVASLVASPAGRADDWREMQRAHELAFSRPGELAEKRQVLADLVAAGTNDAVTLAFDSLEILEKEADPIRIRLTAIEPRLAPLQKDILLPTQHREKEILEAEKKELLRKLHDLETLEEDFVDLLSGTQSPEVLKLLQNRGVTHAFWLVRASAAAALGRLAVPETLGAVKRAARDKDHRVRLRAVEALGSFKDVDAVAALSHALENDSDDRIKITAIQSLTDIGGPAAVEALIGSMRSNGGRLIEDCTASLQGMTRQHIGPVYAAWRDWWEQNKEQYAGTEGSVLKRRKLPPPRRDLGSSKFQAPMSYVGIETLSERIVFCLDISDSMRDSSSSTFRNEDGTTDRDHAKRAKMDVMKEETKQAIRGLTETDFFNIVAYNHLVDKWMDKLVPANPSNKALALAYIDSLQPSGGTNIFDALEVCFRMAGLGAYDRYYPSGVDTIFLFSDGAPSHGRMTEPEEIRAEIQRMNDLQKIKIHTIAIGNLALIPFLEPLAKENSGKHQKRN